MKIQYLGTSSAEGYPGMFCDCPQCRTARERGGRNLRTRSQSVMYKEGIGQGEPGEILLIDFPPDVYQHVVQHNLPMRRIGHLIITHSHKDHFCPDGLVCRSNAFKTQKLDFPLQLYGNKEVGERFEIMLEDERRHVTPEIAVFNQIEAFKPFKAGVYTVTPLRADHRSYTAEEKTMIYIVEQAGKRLLYGNDTKIFPEETFEYIAGKQFDLVSLDCNNCGESASGNHMGLPENLKVKERMEKLGCLKADSKIVLNHFSHQSGACYEEMVELARPHGMEVAYDGGVWEV